MTPTRQKNATPPAPLANGAETIDVVADAPSEIEIAAPSDEPQRPASDPGIDDLATQLAEERRKRVDAEAEASRLRSERQQQAKEVVDNRMLVLDATIQRQEGEKATILSQIKAAKEAGDYDAEVDATDKLSTINIDLKQTRLGKSRLEAELEDGGGHQTQQRQGDNPTGDPLEAYIQNNRLHPRAGDWLRNHRDYAEDPVKNAELTRAHHLALRGGAALNSDAYYEALETELGLRESQRQDEPSGDLGGDNQRQRGNGMPPSAPPSRGNGMGGGANSINLGEGRTITDLGGGKLRMSPQMVAYAADLGMTPKEYADQALALKREGKLN